MRGIQSEFNKFRAWNGRIPRLRLTLTLEKWLNFKLTMKDARVLDELAGLNSTLLGVEVAGTAHGRLMESSVIKIIILSQCPQARAVGAAHILRAAKQHAKRRKNCVVLSSMGVPAPASHTGDQPRCG